MAEQNEIERYCRNCVSRDFATGRGLICKRTNTLPAFEESCADYQKDEELEKMAPTPQFEDGSVQLAREQLLAEQNLSKALMLGILACLVGAMIWCLISISIKYQIAYMAIGVGVLVGMAVRQGKGVTPIFGIIGAILALLSCALGDFFSLIGFVAQEYEVSYMEALTNVDYNEIFSLMIDNLLSMTVLFYGIALYEGYILSFREQKQPKGGHI